MPEKYESGYSAGVVLPDRFALLASLWADLTAPCLSYPRPIDDEEASAVDPAEQEWLIEIEALLRAQRLEDPSMATNIMNQLRGALSRSFVHCCRWKPALKPL